MTHPPADEKMNLERRIRKHIHGKKQTFEIDAPPGFSGLCERFARELVTKKWNSELNDIRITSEHGRVRIEDAPFELCHDLLLDGLPFTDVKILIFRGRCSTDDKFRTILEKISWDMWVPKKENLVWNLRVNSLHSRLYNEGRLKLEMTEFLKRRFSGDGGLPSTEVDCDVWIERESLEIFVSLGGRNYWQRGQKQTLHHAAPLREDIAACLVLRLRELSLEWYGIARPRHVVNPFCGTGTLLHEAATLLQDFGRLPAKHDFWNYKRLPFYRKSSFEHSLKKRNESRLSSNPKSSQVTYLGEDLDKDLCDATEQWFRSMRDSGLQCDSGSARCHDSRAGDLPWMKEVEQGEAIWLLANPPFGLRLSNSHHGGTERLYEDFVKRICAWARPADTMETPLVMGVLLCPTEAIWQSVRRSLKGWPQCCEHFTLGGLDIRAFYFSSPERPTLIGL
jgi:23S rRNA G2445 N2-methylase RlmL